MTILNKSTCKYTYPSKLIQFILRKSIKITVKDTSLLRILTEFLNVTD